MLIYFCISLFLCFLFLGGTALATARLLLKQRAWPALWFVTILCCVISALTTTLMLAKPSLNLSRSFNVPLHRISLQGFELKPARGNESTARSYVDVETAVSGIYLVGVGFFFFRLLNGRRRARTIVNAAEQIGRVNNINVCLTDENVAPFVVSSVNNPKSHHIVVPKKLYSTLSRDEVLFILEHEVQHVKHADDLVGLGLRALVSISWFVPVAHLLAKRWERDIELRCDSLVMDGSSHVRRSSYANTVLKALQLSATRVRQYPVASFSTNHFRNEKMRIKSIVHGDIKTFKGVAPKLIVVTCMTTIGFATSALLSAAPDKAGKPLQHLMGEQQQLILSGRLTSFFGPAKDPFNNGRYRDHKGVDIAAPIGTPIYAPADGVVLAATDLYENKPNYGKVVVIETDNGVQTLFAHLNDIKVIEGQSIRLGDTLGTVGNTGKSTGPHLHLETIAGSKHVNPFKIWRLAN